MSVKYIRNIKTIISFSLIFFLLILCNYLINRYLLHDVIVMQQKDSVKGASKRISKWFQQKIDSTEVIRDFLIDMDHINNESQVKNFLFRSTKVANFRNVYIGYEDETIISGIKWSKPINYVTTKRPWYKNTINKNKVIVTSSYVDIGLKEPVISICAPLKQAISKKKGVVCGILPLEKIKQEILDISLPYDGFAFIINYYGKIMLYPDSNKHLIITHFKSLINNNRSFIDNTYLFYQEKIKFSNWHIVAQLKKNSVYEKINFQLLVNLLIYGISILLFLLLNFFYYKNQRDSDENLKKTKSILNHFIHHGNSGVLIIDNKDKIIFKNKLFRKFLQVNNIKEKLLDKNITIFDKFPNDLKKSILDCINRVKQDYKVNELELIFEEEEGLKYFLFETFPVLSEDGIYQGVILSTRDITMKQKEIISKKEQEDILFQQSKMADLGEMIASISHQWRQPLNSLSIMIGNVLQFKRLNRLSDDILEENLNYSLSNIQYLADTIDTFRNFYKPNKKWQTFNIDEAIEEVSKILSPQFKGLVITLNIQKGKYKRFECLNYKNEFQQIVANLLQNAKDAILEENTDSKEIIVSIKLEEHVYNIEISDYGVGVNSDIQSKIFQAFETTKKEKGTGSGLYLSRLIAKKKLNGNLSIESYSKPTIFLIKIPCNKKDSKNVR